MNDKHFKHDPICQPPDFPNFCPPPVHKPCHHMPPVPSVVEGESLYEAVNNLTNRVNVCINTYNHVMDKSFETLRKLEEAAQENGAYYGPCEVYTEDGYYADESATFKITHKACVDRRGEPIRIQLALAYGNTTNSAIEQSIIAASKVKFADKILVAQPIPAEKNGWYGKCMYKNAPIPSTDRPELYTMGFTRHGVMRVYNNSITHDQLERDTIENAMGVSGVLIQNGEVCDDSYFTKIPAALEQTARVAIGQNLNTMEVLILTCGDENDINKKGLTSKAVAKILRQYGCDIAVELCEGDGSMAMDKGQFMYPPTNNEMPKAYAFWFISRKHYYKTDYERELATLMQNFGENLWYEFLTQQDLNATKEKLDSEVGRLEGLIDTEKSEREAADKTLQQNIDNEAAERKAEDTRLDGKIDTEQARAEAAESALGDRITAEQTRAEAAETALGTRIDEEAQTREENDNTLDGKITAEQTRAELAEDAIRQSVTELGNRVTAVENSVNLLQTTMAKLQGDVSTVQNTIIEIQGTISEQQTTLGKFQSDLGDFKLQLADMSRKLDDLDPEKLARQVADLFNTGTVDLILPAATTTKLGCILVTDDFTIDLAGHLKLNEMTDEDIESIWNDTEAGE